MIDVAALRNHDQKPILCSSCEDKLPAAARCIECMDFLCYDCRNAHMRLRLTKSHRVIHKSWFLSYSCVQRDRPLKEWWSERNFPLAGFFFCPSYDERENACFRFFSPFHKHFFRTFCLTRSFTILLLFEIFCYFFTTLLTPISFVMVDPKALLVACKPLKR